MIYANRDIYEGEWTNDKREPNGRMNYHGGGYYEGPWHDDKRSGKGDYRTTSLIGVRGIWANDSLNGPATLLLPGKLNQPYQIEFLSNTPHGTIIILKKTPAEDGPGLFKRKTEKTGTVEVTDLRINENEIVWDPTDLDGNLEKLKNALK
jgi:hypothetical protein